MDDSNKNDPGSEQAWLTAREFVSRIKKSVEEHGFTKPTFDLARELWGDSDISDEEVRAKITPVDVSEDLIPTAWEDLHRRSQNDAPPPDLFLQPVSLNDYNKDYEGSLPKPPRGGQHCYTLKILEGTFSQFVNLILHEFNEQNRLPRYYVIANENEGYWRIYWRKDPITASSRTRRLGAENIGYVHALNLPIIPVNFFSRDPGLGQEVTSFAKALVVRMKDEGFKIKVHNDVQEPGIAKQAEMQSSVEDRIISIQAEQIEASEETAVIGQDTTRKDKDTVHKRGMSKTRKSRANLFRKIKQNNPHLSYQGVATHANTYYSNELTKVVEPHDVRNDYQAMGWKWERADRIL